MITEHYPKAGERVANKQIKINTVEFPTNQTLTKFKKILCYEQVNNLLEIVLNIK